MSSDVQDEQIQEQRPGQRLAQRRKQQREEDRAELQQVILDVARRIAVAEGWPAVTIRRIADEIGYSAASIYEYFESKEEMLVALKRQGFQILLKEMERVWASETQPATQIVETTLAQWDFAWQHLELFQVMYSIDVRCGTDTPLERKEVYMAVKAKMAELLANAEVQVSSVEDVMLTVQSLLIGLVMQVLNGRIPGGREQARGLMKQGVNDFLTAWGASR